MGNEEKDAAREGAGDESKRILEDSYLTGAVGMSTTPRLSASRISPKDDDGDSYLFEDESWRSRAEVEGEPGEGPPPKRGFFRRLFGG